MNDETLVQLYYRDGLDADELARLEAAVEADASLRARFATLRAELDGIARIAPEPAPARARAAWHAALEQAARAPRPAARTAPPAFGWPAGLAAAVLVGIAVGITVGVQIDEAPPPGAPRVAAVDERRPLVERGLAQHLRAGRVELARFGDSPEPGRDEVLRGLLEQNRLQQRVAEAAEAEDLVRLLRAFELALLRLDRDGGDTARLLARLDSEFQTTLQRLDRAPAMTGSAPTPI